MPKITFAVAGSLAAALEEFARTFTAKTGYGIDMHQGPAGLLTKEIREARLPVDVFVSASPAGPEALHRLDLVDPPRVIASNRMVLVVRPGLDACVEDPRILLADPRWRIGMSTPGADPSGDYAAAFLERLKTENPHHRKSLGQRCVSLYGAVLPDPHEPPRSPALAALVEGRADILIVYSTTADRIARSLPGTRTLPLPLDLAPPTAICACMRSDSPDPARRFFEALQGADCRLILRSHGFFAAQISWLGTCSGQPLIGKSGNDQHHGSGQLSRRCHRVGRDNP